MNRKERNHRFALTLLLASLVFCIGLISVTVSGIAVNILIKTGIIPLLGKVQALKYGLWLMGIISLVVASAVTAVTSKISLMHVNRIVDQMNRLASGDFKARLNIGKPISKHPTVAEVTESFNKMAEELENTEMLRGDFINNFSHEFKTPIVSIAGFAKLLKKGNLTEEQKQEYIDIIEKESLRLSDMATNVLNLTKYENQAILTDITNFNLSEQLRSSILALEGKWVKKNIDFNLVFEEYRISANQDMLKHVWINLIDNAVKFSPDGGTVEISVRLENGMYSVSVQNEGKEISEEQQQKIFNKFYQGDESHASEGNGIGLALVKSVVKLHKGEVSVNSKNGYTVFTVKLPEKQDS